MAPKVTDRQIHKLIDYRPATFCRQKMGFTSFRLCAVRWLPPTRPDIEPCPRGGTLPGCQRAARVCQRRRSGGHGAQRQRGAGGADAEVQGRPRAGGDAVLRHTGRPHLPPKHRGTPQQKFVQDCK